jgi:prevent-host-death family protein
MKKVPLYEIKNALSRYLRAAEKEEIVITRHGRPAGLLIGFESEDDWFEYRMQRDPEFLRRVEIARGKRRIRYGVKRPPGKGPRKEGAERRAK